MARQRKPPSEKIVRIRPARGKRLRSLDEFVQPERTSWFSASGPRPRLPSYLRGPGGGSGGGSGGGLGGRRLPEGAKAGLVLIAAVCVGIAIGAYQAFGPRHIIADEVASDETSTGR
jgi:hypothetical protein